MPRPRGWTPPRPLNKPPASTSPACTTDPEPPPTPFWQTTDAGATCRLYRGDAAAVLARLPAKSIHCVVTSPPYWGLRDYEACACKLSRKEPDPDCPTCGGSGKVPGMAGQLGAEPSPDCKTDGQAQCGACFVCNMVKVFRVVRRVLRDDGTCWLNLGDSYTSGGRVGHGTRVGYKQQTNRGMNGVNDPLRVDAGLPAGNLVGVPWRIALALQADGWVLRQDIIWQKVAPMPESVRNRCTKAHEYVFLLAKGMDYYYDKDAIATERGDGPPPGNVNHKAVTALEAGDEKHRTKGGLLAYAEQARNGEVVGTANRRSVWRISGGGYRADHFATFPPELPELCIKAGTSERGCCPDCGAPWRRVTAETKLTRDRPHDYVKRTGAEGTGNSCANSVAGVAVETVGWEPGCECRGTFVSHKVLVMKSRVVSVPGKGTVDGGGPPFPAGYSEMSTLQRTRRSTVVRQEEEVEKNIVEYVSEIPLEEHPVVPCVVLDPFLGAATTAKVALDLGRRAQGVELSEQYLKDNAIPRVEGALYSRPATARLIPRKKPGGRG